MKKNQDIIIFPPCNTDDIKIDAVIIGDQFYKLDKPLDVQLEEKQPAFEKLEVKEEL